jgi:cation-transporting P-type ATPase 13A2
VLPQICIQIVFQICIVFILLNQPYTNTSHFSKAPAFAENNGGVNTMETNTLFLISNMQYIAACFAFTMGKPFREPVYKNVAFIINILVIVILNVYINIYPAKWLQRIFEVFQ